MKGRQPESLAAISLPYQLFVMTQEPATLLTKLFTFWMPESQRTRSKRRSLKSGRKSWMWNGFRGLRAGDA